MELLAGSLPLPTVRAESRSLCPGEASSPHTPLGSHGAHAGWPTQRGRVITGHQRLREPSGEMWSCSVPHTPEQPTPPRPTRETARLPPRPPFGDVMGALASCRSLLHLSAQVKDPGHLHALQLPRKSGSTGAGFRLRTWDWVRQRSPVRRWPPHDPKLPSGC